MSSTQSQSHFRAPRSRKSSTGSNGSSGGRRSPYFKTKKERVAIHEFDIEYVDEEHLEAFRKALLEDPERDTTEHIAAVTDILPIRQRIGKKFRSKKFNSYSYQIFRYPLMIFIFVIIAFEMVLYVSIRQIVNSWEYFVVWRGEKMKLREQLRSATTYEEWKKAAKRLDSYMNKDEWKEDPQYEFYNYNLIQKVNHTLRKLREADKAADVKDALQMAVKGNFGGVENARLYSHTYHGTKTVVEDYVNEVTASLEYICKSDKISLEEKRQLFKSYYKNYGRIALCLSGGAGFGYYHLGVVKALLESNLLPTVITGTSAGGLLAALICCRTDDELRQVLVPELHTKLTACADPFTVWFPRFLRYGSRFDANDWARKTQWVTKGSLTFMEAYQRTGRILNISVIPYDPHSPPKLLNYLTAPDCVIWSAVIASAAVPGILNPVVLMRKTETGQLIPYNYGHKWKDGSLRTDIPLSPLYTQFNVNYTVVSQVNPHIHLFFYAPRGSIGRPVSHRHGSGWRGGFLLSGLEQYLKLDLSKWLKVIRDLELLPNLMNQDWSSIWLQKFDGHVTILPKSTFSDWRYILSDPDWERMKRFIDVGEKQTFPKLHMISNRMRIERAIIGNYGEVKRQLVPKGQLSRIEGSILSSEEEGAHRLQKERKRDGRKSQEVRELEEAVEEAVKREMFEEEIAIDAGSE